MIKGILIEISNQKGLQYRRDWTSRGEALVYAYAIVP